MVDVTVTKTFIPLPGLAMGTGSGAQDTYILDTGLAEVKGMVITGIDTDDVTGGMTSQSNGKVTIWLYSAGSGHNAPATISWIAWGSN